MAALLTLGLAQVGLAALPEAPPAAVAQPFPLTAAALAEGELPMTRLLDALAPLGDGKGNAAEFFASLRPGAPGAGDLEAAFLRAHDIDLGIDRGPALAPDDPLLLAAAGWTLQPRCEFFPDVVPFVGWDTWRVDEELALLFARSWVAEARATGAAEPARRAVRLGRLLLLEDAWYETSQAGRRATVLGANELRRQAMAGQRSIEAIAALRVLAPTQSEWLGGRHLAMRFAHLQRDLADPGSSAWESVVPLSVQRWAALGGVHRLRAALQAWPGARSRRSAVREAWRPTLRAWAEERGPARDEVLATAAAWWLEQDWKPDSPAWSVPIPNPVGWGPTSDDPLERLLTDRAPRALRDHRFAAPWEEEPTLPWEGPRPAKPAFLFKVSVEEHAELSRRRVSRTIAGPRAPVDVLPFDDPLVVQAESWLRAGGQFLGVEAGDREGWCVTRTRWLIWKSLVHRADRLWGTPAGDGTRSALAALCRQLDDGVPAWGWRGGGVPSMWLASLQASQLLGSGRPAEALDAEHFLRAEELRSVWRKALLAPPALVTQRRVDQAWLGFGPVRGDFLDSELDTLEALISLRPEPDIRSEAAEALWLVSHAGSFGQRRRAKRLLNDLAGDRDASVAAGAKMLLQRPFTHGKKAWDVRLSELYDSAVGD